MPQTRRHFLATLAAAFFGAATIRRVTPAEINPSWLTAKPLPPSEGIALDWWSQVGDEALRILEGELRCLKVISAPAWEGYSIPGFDGLGYTYRLREPLRFDAREPDWGNINQMVTDRLHYATINRHSGVHILLAREDECLTLKEFTGRLLEPAMCNLADCLFRSSRGSDLIVTAPLQPFPTSPGAPASVVASNDKFSLRAAYDWRRDPGTGTPIERIVRFDMLWGAVRS